MTIIEFFGNVFPFFYANLESHCFLLDRYSRLLFNLELRHEKISVLLKYDRFHLTATVYTFFVGDVFGLPTTSVLTSLPAVCLSKPFFAETYKN